VTLKPVEETLEPVEETLEPVEETLEPVEETLEPVEETLEPVEETLKPVEETLKPVEETLEPVEETLEPVEETLEPVEETLEPVEETLELVEETLELVEETKYLVKALSFLFGELFIADAADEQEEGGDADAGIGDIESGPPAVAGGYELVVEREFDGDEVDDVALGKTRPEAGVLEFIEQEALHEAVGEVAENAAEQQRDGDFGQGMGEDPFFPEDANHR
jgi:uncharacterized protein YoxC